MSAVAYKLRVPINRSAVETVRVSPSARGVSLMVVTPAVDPHRFCWVLRVRVILFLLQSWTETNIIEKYALFLHNMRLSCCTKMIINSSLSMRASIQTTIPLLGTEEAAGNVLILAMLRLRRQSKGSSICLTFCFPTCASALRVCRLSSFVGEF